MIKDGFGLIGEPSKEKDAEYFQDAQEVLDEAIQDTIHYFQWGVIDQWK